MAVGEWLQRHYLYSLNGIRSYPQRTLSSFPFEFDLDQWREPSRRTGKSRKCRRMFG